MGVLQSRYRPGSQRCPQKVKDSFKGFFPPPLGFLPFFNLFSIPVSQLNPLFTKNGKRKTHNLQKGLGTLNPKRTSHSMLSHSKSPSHVTSLSVYHSIEGEKKEKEKKKKATSGVYPGHTVKVYSGRSTSPQPRPRKVSTGQKIKPLLSLFFLLFLLFPAYF